MGLKVLNQTQEEDERSCQEKIFNHILSRNDFVFNAGAGSGKTFSLKESIKYTLHNFSSVLEKRTQRILCITYTNLAANEVKNRIGNTNLVDVSTIHEGFWNIVKSQQSALRKIHTLKLEEEIKKVKSDFEFDVPSHDWFYAQTDINKREQFCEKLITKEIVDKFYKSKQDKNLPANFSGMLEENGYSMHRNQGKFESTFKFLNNLDKLSRGLKDIQSKRGIKIKYNTRSNFDRLYKMEISHDSLLEYVYRLCSSYPTMLDIILDKFPFIFVDEYQDTNDYVVRTLDLISKRASLRKRQVCIGYFGDTLQNIYSDGVGAKIHTLHSGLSKVEKKQNRRSYSEIIKVFDKFRNDDLSQISIYEDCFGGNFRYYLSKIKSDDPEYISESIGKIKKEFELNESDSVCCLVLKNDTISEISGFYNFYKKMKSAFYYSDAPKLIINKDLKKLNDVVKEIYNLIDFMSILDRKDKHLSNIIPSQIGNITFSEVKVYYDELKNIEIDYELSLKENLSTILDKEGGYSRLFMGYLSETITCVDADYTLSNIVGGLNDLLERSSSKDSETSRKIIDELLNIKLIEFKKWFCYLNADPNNEDLYLTCHNSKGLEFETVIVFLSDSFSNKSNYLSAFFDDTENDEYAERRNLLYVSLSRAIKNMAVVFTYQENAPSINASNFFGEGEFL